MKNQNGFEKQIFYSIPMQNQNTVSSVDLLNLHLLPMKYVSMLFRLGALDSI